MTKQKNYRLLRFLQLALALLGWLCIIASPFIFIGLPGLVAVGGGDASSGVVALAISFGLSLSVFTVGLGYLIAGQIIEVFVDIASNTQSSANLLDHMIRHWPATNPAPLTGPMPAVTMAQIPETFSKPPVG